MHFINGEEVLQFRIHDMTQQISLAKKFIVGGNDVVKDGYISLQSNSNPMDFSKIEIMEY